MSAKRRKPRRRRQRQRFGLIRSLVARLSDSVSTVRHAVAEPRSVPLQVRDAFLRMWRRRGGGFYGLGYVIAFGVLEIEAYISSWESASDNVVGLVLQEVLQFVFRFAAQSMLNGFLALGWPIFVVEKLGGAGLVLLAVSWWLFDRYARPWIAARLPEPARPAHAAAPDADGEERPEPNDDVSPARTAPLRTDVTGADAPSPPMPSAPMRDADP